MQKMIVKMAKMYPVMIVMGFMIVLIAFVVGYFNSQTAAAYFGEAKALRETTLMAQRASIESIGLWLPPFKFLGIGLILGGIVMALRIIIDNLKAAGVEVLSNVPAEKRPQMPATPWYASLMPAVMMLGEVVFLVAFGVGVWLSGLARTVFANPLPTIDAAGAGLGPAGQPANDPCGRRLAGAAQVLWHSDRVPGHHHGPGNDHLHPQRADQHVGPWLPSRQVRPGCQLREKEFSDE